MKIYKTIKIDDIEHAHGWDIDRVFVQTHIEPTYESEIVPPTYAGGSSTTMSTSGTAVVKKTYALLSKDSDAHSREQELDGKLATVRQTAVKYALELEEAKKKLANFEVDVKRMQEDRDASVQASHRDRERMRVLEKGLSEKQGIIDKLKLAIGELRYREVVSAGEGSA